MTAQIGSGIDTSEQALREYYTAHAREFETAGRVKARHIVVKTEAEAISLLGRLRRNADFAALAREHNIDASKEKSGDLGWVARGVMVKPFENALFSLQAGTIGPIVKTSFGFHIVKAEEIEKARAKPFETVSSDVRQKLIADGIAAARAALAKKHPITVNDAVLKSLR
jgi:parvulin-like peptidyl-prolyl isomerase